MHFLERCYRSPFGRILSILASLIGNIHKPYMVYGYYDRASRKFQKYTRISSSTVIMNKDRLSIADRVWVWHYSILDASDGLTIDEGVQIGAWVGLFTHSSENSIRLLGPEYVHIPHFERKGNIRGSIHIGAYSFIASRSVILPGVNIGKGCFIGTGSVVSKNVPDYSIIVGNPARYLGSTIDKDIKSFAVEDFSDSYYDEKALEAILAKNN